MNFYRWFVAIFILLVTILGLGFVKFQQVQAAMAMAEAFPEPSAAVNTVVAEKSEYRPSIEVTGQVQAIRIVELQNELPGVIDFVDFNGGDTVNQGQLLLSQITKEEKAQLTAAKATLKQTQNNFARMQKLVQSDKVSQQEFDDADAQYKIAKANVTNLESVIAKKQIRAPFNGKLGLETYQVGQYLAANSVLTTLVDDGPVVWVDFQLSQTHRRLNIDEQVYVRSISQGNQAQWHKAKVIASNSQINANSRHMTYRAEISEGGKWLQHNEIVKVKVGETPLQVVKVPSAAVIRSKAGDFVYELVEDETGQQRAKPVAVVTGTRIGDEQIILSGLDSGALIATEGAFKLYEGILVYPKANEAAGKEAS